MASQHNKFVSNDRRTGFGGLTSSIVVLSIVLLFCVFYFAACADNKPAPGADVAAGTIVQNPSAYIGKTVTVSGDVEEVHGPRAFSMDSGTGLGELLVLGREPFPNVPSDGNRAYLVDDTVKVTGTVRMLVTANVEREIGWDLDRQLVVTYEGKPVLIAQTANFTPNPNRSKTTAAPSPAATVNAQNTPAEPTQSTLTEPITDVVLIITTPDRPSLIGKRVQLTDVKIQSVVGDRGFWIGSGKQRLFARLDEKLDKGTAEWDVDVNAGQTRTITGVIEKLPSMDEIQRWGLSPQEAAALKDQQVYLRVEKFKHTLR